jgi:hypothetical protein
MRLEIMPAEGFDIFRGAINDNHASHAALHPFACMMLVLMVC